MTEETRELAPGSDGYRRQQRAELLRFARAARCEAGFGYLDTAGVLDPAEAMPLYVACRMTHVFSLGVLAAEPPAEGGPNRSEMADLAEHGVRALTSGPFHDDEYGGWYAAINPDETVDGAKQAYAHSFVVLAAASAVAADVPGSQRLLDMALAVLDEYFWDEAAGMIVDEWNREFSWLKDYRGANANMHTVEAFLAAGDVTGDGKWHRRAGRIARRIVSWAKDMGWRVPEHADGAYSPLPEFHREQPAHAFQPFGATVGHGMEWARLLVAVHETLGDEAPDGLVEAAVALNDRAVKDGWGVDGADGFVYTTDWDGTPVVRARMHWVAAEAICTATILQRVTGDERYAVDLQRWWDYTDQYLVDHEWGSWHHELDRTNKPASETWSGKPDVYHAYQAALIADVPTTPSFATALARRTATNE